MNPLERVRVAISNTRRFYRNRTNAGLNLALGKVALTNDPPFAQVIPYLFVLIDKKLDFGLQCPG